MARLQALTELIGQDRILWIAVWILRLIFVLLDTAVLAKLMQKQGLYDIVLQSISQNYTLKQNRMQDAEKDVIFKECDLVRQKRLIELDDQIRKEELSAHVKNYRQYTQEFLLQSDEFFSDMNRMMSDAGNISDPLLKTIAENNMKEMTDAYDLMRNGFLTNSDASLKRQAPNHQNHASAGNLLCIINELADEPVCRVMLR